MADYFPVLSRAVAGLESNTGEARRAVYERARAAIVRQLRAIDPPLSEEDISRERLQLEEAIRKVEAGAGGPAQAAAAPRPAPATPKAEAPPPPARKKEAAPPPPNPASQQPAPKAPPPPAAKTAAPQPRPAKRPDGRPIIPASGGASRAAPRKRSSPLVAVGALALIALVVGGVFVYRYSASTSSRDVAEVSPSTTSPGTAPSASGKSEDRPPQYSPPAAEQPQQPPAPEQQASREQPPAAEPAPAPSAEPAPPPAAVTETAPASPPPSQTGPLVAQRATLYEEGPNQQSGEALTGTVVWRTESVSVGQSQPLETAIRGDIDIPGRKLKATIVIRRNADATLPASHTIEIQFNLPPDFPNAGVANVPGVVMKADESARGATVAGLSVKVTNGFFLIGLSNLETERTVNEQLLRDRSWIDIPILYDNGRRAVLTLEKGTPGVQAFNDALDSWRGTPAAAQAQPAQ